MLHSWAAEAEEADPPARAKTGADGRALLDGLPGRRHRIGTRQLDRLAPSRWHEVRPGGTDEVTLSLRATDEIRGVVTDANGRPLTYYESGGKRMSVTPWARSELAQQWSLAQPLEADGSFTSLVPADDPGPFRVEFNLPPEGGSQTGGAVEGVRPGDDDVRLVLRPRSLDE